MPADGGGRFIDGRSGELLAVMDLERPGGFIVAELKGGGRPEIIVCDRERAVHCFAAPAELRGRAAAAPSGTGRKAGR